MTLDKLKQYVKDHKDKDKSTIVVGYSQKYALEVHERTDVRHKVGQSKYLETAARVNEHKIKTMVNQAPKDKLAETLLKCGLLIQRESQELVPVDTSALKASAFTTIEEELDRVSSEARAKAEIIRMTTLAKREAKKRSKGK